jgi:hypothetical protein
MADNLHQFRRSGLSGTVDDAIGFLKSGKGLLGDQLLDEYLDGVLDPEEFLQRAMELGFRGEGTIPLGAIGALEIGRVPDSPFPIDEPYAHAPLRLLRRLGLFTPAIPNLNSEADGTKPDDVYIWDFAQVTSSNGLEVDGRTAQTADGLHKFRSSREDLDSVFDDIVDFLRSEGWRGQNLLSGFLNDTVSVDELIETAKELGYEGRGTIPHQIMTGIEEVQEAPFPLEDAHLYEPRTPLRLIRKLLGTYTPSIPFLNSESDNLHNFVFGIRLPRIGGRKKEVSPEIVYKIPVTEEEYDNNGNLRERRTIVQHHTAPSAEQAKAAAIRTIERTASAFGMAVTTQAGTIIGTILGLGAAALVHKWVVGKATRSPVSADVAAGVGKILDVREGSYKVFSDDLNNYVLGTVAGKIAGAVVSRVAPHVITKPLIILGAFAIGKSLWEMIVKTKKTKIEKTEIEKLRLRVWAESLEQANREVEKAFPGSEVVKSAIVEGIKQSLAEMSDDVFNFHVNDPRTGERVAEHKHPGRSKKGLLTGATLSTIVGATILIPGKGGIAKGASKGVRRLLRRTRRRKVSSRARPLYGELADSLHKLATT